MNGEPSTTSEPSAQPARRGSGKLFMVAGLTLILAIIAVGAPMAIIFTTVGRTPISIGADDGWCVARSKLPTQPVLMTSEADHTRIGGEALRDGLRVTAGDEAVAIEPYDSFHASGRSGDHRSFGRLDLSGVAPEATVCFDATALEGQLSRSEILVENDLSSMFLWIVVGPCLGGPLLLVSATFWIWAIVRLIRSELRQR